MTDVPLWRELRAEALDASWALRPWRLRYRPGRPRSGWSRRAACDGLPTDLFFEQKTTGAIRVCEQCPVRQDCLFDAFEIESQARLQYIRGVRGGLPEEVRVDVMRRRREWEKSAA